MAKSMPVTVRPESKRQQGDTRSPAGRQHGSTDDLFDDIARKNKELRERQRRANQGDADELIPPIYKAAVAAWPGGQEAYAARLGIARSSLVEMCAGERPIEQRDILPLRGCRASWAIWTQGTASLGGLLAIVSVLPRLTVAELKEDALDFIVRNPAIYRLFREQEAVQRGIGEEEVDAVVEKWRRDEDAPETGQDASSDVEQDAVRS